jgi:ketosteroid isomerase-like protein
MTCSSVQDREIRDVFAQYALGYRNKDMRAILGICSPAITGFGSGPDEIVRGKPQLKKALIRDFSQADQISLAFPGMEIAGAGPVAWVTSGCRFTLVIRGTGHSMTGRFTAVVRNTGSRWLIEQIHFSMPDGAQDAGQSFPQLAE